MNKPPRSGPIGLDAATDEFHRQLLAEALQQKATLAQAARQLKISLSRLHYMMARLGVERTITHTVQIRIRKK
jgi:transcriptional regulator with GAF, ATPase, and Fis domain